MIYVDQKAKEWCVKHPGLSVEIVECFDCGSSIPVDRPFLADGIAGLIAEECPICRAPRKSYTYVPVSREEKASWEYIL